jgi:hypothetical protein
MFSPLSQEIVSEITCQKVRALEIENRWDPTHKFSVKLAEFRSKKFKANYICGAQIAKVNLV